MKIIFLDVDGPLIPARMYCINGGRPFDNTTGSFIYDPVAIGMIVNLCNKYDCKVVFNSAHNENPEHIMRYQGKVNGLGEVLHEIECKTKFCTEIDDRLRAIIEWLSRNPADDWIVIDDMPVSKNKQILVNYQLGVTAADFYDACKLLGGSVPSIQFVGQTNYHDYKV